MKIRTTRYRIIEAADQLFYQQGYENTSFADIAAAVQISSGNCYHHFKTKDEILAAVIEFRLAKTQALLEQWAKDGDTPEARIRSFIHILMMNKSKIKLYGCPVGTLCSELAKLDHVALDHANDIFTLFRAWLRKQFSQLGCKRESDDLAMYLLVQSQGVATLASAFQDEKIIKKEVKRINAWLTTQVEEYAR